MKKTASLLLITAFVLIAAANAQSQHCERYLGFWSNGVDTIQITETEIILNSGPPAEYSVVERIVEDDCILYCLRLETPGDSNLSHFLNLEIKGPVGGEEMTVSRYNYEAEASHLTNCVGEYFFDRAYGI